MLRLVLVALGAIAFGAIVSKFYLEVSQTSQGPQIAAINQQIPAASSQAASSGAVSPQTNASVASDYAQMPWEEKTPSLGVLTAMPAGELSAEQLQTLSDIGGELFSAQFTTQDGGGRPMATQAILPTKTNNPLRMPFTRTSGPDAGACASCHNQPFAGGAGDFVVNVFATGGVIDTIDPKFSHERGTNHLFGAGLVELLAREMTQDLLDIRTQAVKQARQDQQIVRLKLETKGVAFGHISATPDGYLDLSELEGVDADLIIKPFTQKGVMVSLRQFSVNAMNHHHGMQAVERFGVRWTGEDDFDEDGMTQEVSSADISAMVAWQATLPSPVQIVPDDAQWQELASTGAEQFGALGCSTCHKPSLPLKSLKFQDPGPFDLAGTLNNKDVANPAIYDLGMFEWAKNLPRNDKGEVLVPLFGDLKRHHIADAEVDRLGNELGGQRFVDRTQFVTAELWGVGDSQPYGHRNDITTMDEVIRAHGGDARASRDAYIGADEAVRRSIIAYLKSLKIVEAR